MRIKIREQLSILVTLVALCSVAIPSIISWVSNYNFVTGQRLSRLSLIADLKSQQLAQSVTILYNSVNSISSRIIIQETLKKYIATNDTSNTTWQSSLNDLMVALSTQNYLLHGTLYNANMSVALLNVTTDRALGIGGLAANTTTLNTASPQNNSGGYNWNGHVGFPDSLYPRSSNIAATPMNKVALFTPALIMQNNGLMLGPVMVNSTFYLSSFTVPILDSTSPGTVLGYLTVVFSAALLLDVVQATQGFDDDEQLIIVGPNSDVNFWVEHDGMLNLTNQNLPSDAIFKYILPPVNNPSLSGTSANVSDFPAVRDCYHLLPSTPARSLLDTTDPQGNRISVGYRLPAVPFVDWALIVTESHDDLLLPVTHLRKILLATIFGTLGVVILLVVPLAHFFVRPIIRLKSATKQRKKKAQFTPDGGSGTNLSQHADQDGPPNGHLPNGVLQRPNNSSGGVSNSTQSEEKRGRYMLGIFAVNRRQKPVIPPFEHEENKAEEGDNRSSIRGFRIPSKIPERKHIIYDELTDLTHTFNEMTEELVQQYDRLEDRVRERTKQLEESRQLAETANEAKSRFIANITHELRTPLNGILGMCSVCLAEDDLSKIKQSLGIVYNSGELLLKLLTDLLTFSKTQFGGHTVTLEMRQFRIVDITNQVLPIFDKQAKDGKIDLGVEVLPERTVLDMMLWGDSNRILQVIINLISNGLKFTPPGGSVQLRISLGPEVKEVETPRKSGESQRNSRSSSLQGRPAPILKTRRSLSNSIFTQDGTVMQKADREATYGEDNESINNTKTYMFEFLVRDTGPGIPPDQQKKVFDPFVQGELGLNKRFGGTGLGLSICRQLAGLMNGTVTLESTEGVGSSFSLRIPLQLMTPVSSSVSSMRTTHLSPNSKPDVVEESGKLAQIPQPRLVGYSSPFFVPTEIVPDEPALEESYRAQIAEAKKGMGPSIRVLVAEDNKINQEVVLRMLRLESIEDITLAADGQEAVERVKEAIEGGHAFNVVFMDVQMPNLDGLESTRIIRELGYTAPIVALSALTEESNIQECLDSGMNYFLSKPIRRPALKQVLKTFCTPIREVEEVPDVVSPSATI